MPLKVVLKGTRDNYNRAMETFNCHAILKNYERQPFLLEKVIPSICHT